MNKLYTLLALLAVTSIATAQVYTTTGPRTFFNIPATDSHYTFFNLESGKQVPVSDSATANWHIAFNKTKVLFNSGNAGPGSVQAQLLEQDFMAVKTLPSAGYRAEDLGAMISPSGSGNGWYDYNSSNNVITSKLGRSFAIKFGSKFALLQILDYYKDQDINLASGNYSIRYQISASADVSNKFTRVGNLYAGYSTKQLFNLANGDTLVPADSATDKWHMAFMATTIYGNSGSSGPGSTQLQIVDQTYDAIQMAPIDGYKSDEEGSPAIATGSGNGWYTYNITVHSITPNAARTILVQDGKGHYAKVSIKSYYKDAPANPTFLDQATTRYYTFEYFFNPIKSRELNDDENITSGNGIEESQFGLFNLYPNPSNGGVINVSGAKVGTHCQLIDLQGKVLAQTAINAEGSSQINTEHFPAGLYLVMVGAQAQKLIIE